jgi:predicted DNA-binding transcriptional regulator YafY
MKKVEGLEKGLNLPKHMAEHIYMFSGKSEKVLFKVDKSRLDDIVDWFGTDFKIRKKLENHYLISVDVNINAMYYWALQYGQYVDVIKPESLREKLHDTISDMYARYSVTELEEDYLPKKSKAKDTPTSNIEDYTTQTTEE